MSTMFLLLFALSLPSMADDATEAERVRLSEEMENLALRGQWVAVERKYQQILDLKKVTLKYDDHLLGAQSAAGVGNLALAYERLNLALSIEDNAEGTQWKKDIEGNYGMVSIKTAKKSAPVSIRPVKMPFIPEQQDAIQLASKRLSTNGHFDGFLPFGDYTAGEMVFTVERSPQSTSEPLAVTVKQSESSDAVAANPKRDSKGSFGPWVSLGGAFLQAGNAEIENAVFENQGGLTAQAGVGFQLKIRPAMILGLELAYGGTRVAESQDSIIDSELRHYHAWLPFGVSKKSMTYLLGPTYFVASTSISGEMKATSISVGSSQQPVAFEGFSGGAGLQLGAQKSLFSIGKSLDGGLTLSSAVEHDGVRLYSWGQLAFTISPNFTEKG